MQLRVMSFNIRGSFHHEDGVNAWDKRCDLNVATIKRHAPDILGIQEAQSGTIADYEKHLSDYAMEQGLISIRQTERRHYVPIYYRADRFEKVRSGGFYLSDTPETWSIGWDAVYPRAVTWIILHDKAVEQNIFVLNTHYNHERDNHRSRIESSKLIVEQALSLGDSFPQIVMGDFNARPNGEAYQIFIENGYEDTFTLAGCDDESHTVHAYQGNTFPHQDARIDWMLLSDKDKQFFADSFDIIRDHEHPIYPSDHYPILTEFEWTTTHA